MMTKIGPCMCGDTECPSCGPLLRWVGGFKIAETVDDISHRRAPMGPDDVVCPHGHAMDVHCCGCHSGFLFDPDSCICLELLDYMTANLDVSLEDAIEIVNDARVDAEEARRLAGCE